MYWHVEHLLVCVMCLSCSKHLYDIAVLLIVIVCLFPVCICFRVARGGTDCNRVYDASSY